MEIRMVKCPHCNTVYNEAMSAACPNCAGQQPGASGFGKTTMPGSNANNGFHSAPGNNSFGFAAGTNGFPQTTPPTGVNSFPKTGYPSQGGAASVNSFPQSGTGFPSGGVIGGTFPQTKPPADSRFVHTQYVGESALTRAEMRVTGWLVIMDGKNAGRDYRIHTGYNYIGKEKGDIRIEGDQCISREKDSQIFYDNETGVFYLSHVNGANALRVNGEPVVSGSVKLNAYDILTIGKTHLIFVPLCGEKFKWGEE